MQESLSQTSTTRKEGKQMSYINDFEAKFMNIFIETGLQMIPNSDRSAYNTDQDYEFTRVVTDRLQKFYAIYKPELVTEEVNKDW